MPLPHIKYFFEKTASGTSCWGSFLEWFSTKILPNFIVWLSLLLRIWGNMCIIFPESDVINFKTNLSFLIKLFSYVTKKVGTKIEIVLEQKQLLWWNKKHFFIIFKELSLKQKKKLPENARVVLKVIIEKFENEQNLSKTFEVSSIYLVLVTSIIFSSWQLNVGVKKF